MTEFAVPLESDVQNVRESHTFAAKLAPSIASLFNLSMKTGKLPDEWKLANVLPIPKNSHIQDLQSYRPISLLSIISKASMQILHLVPRPNGLWFFSVSQRLHQLCNQDAQGDLKDLARCSIEPA